MPWDLKVISVVIVGLGALLLCGIGVLRLRRLTRKLDAELRGSDDRDPYWSFDGGDDFVYAAQMQAPVEPPPTQTA